MNTRTNPLLARSLAQATAILQSFAYQPDFLEQLRVAFGDDFDSSVALGIRSLFQAGDFSLIPDLRVLSDGELGTANGAYAGELDEIFVSSDFLAQWQGDVAAIANLLLEEFGHKLDRLLNGNVDSPGDEGAIFAALAQGQTLSTDTLAQLRVEDDHRTISVDGKSVEIEMEAWLGSNGNDTHTGADASNILYGLDGNDSLTGGTGDDTIYGGGGNDTLSGGTGNDTLYGDSGNDFLTGLDGNDSLQGGVGNDTLYGGTGNNTLSGGTGNDTYYLYSGNTETLIDETFGDGIDTLTFAFISGPVRITLSSLFGQVVNVLYNLNLTLNNSDLIENVIGTNYNDEIIGNSLDNTLNGGGGNDSLQGGNGNDTLDGGIGNDSLQGYNGNDTYIFNAAVTGVDIIDEAFVDGIDTLDFSTTATQSISVNLSNLNIQVVSYPTNSSSLQLTLNGSIENVIGGGGNDNIFGSNLDNTLIGGAGNDTLSGGDGNDLLYTGSGNNVLNGGAGNDVLFTSATSLDTLTGGIGDDVYEIHNSLDQIIEISGEGTDSVWTDVSYTLAANVETMYLIGSINGTGNAGDNTIVGYGAGNNVIDGGAGNDNLYGGDGNDVLYAGSGNNILNGGAENDVLFTSATSLDTLTGGTGDDTYEIHNSLDQIVEIGSEGTDSVWTDVSYTLAANVENMYLVGSVNGTGNAGDNTIVGYTPDAHTIDGGAGNDLLVGNTGNDALYGGAGNDNLSGGDGNDLLYAGSGNNALNGGAGNDVLFTSATSLDTLTGGTGDDTYEIHNSLDQIVEIGSEGTDSVWTDVSYTLAANVENMYLVGSIDGTGNAGDNTIVGYGAGNNALYGGAGNDNLYGGDGNDLLYAGSGNNALNGGAGNDVLFTSATSLDTLTGGTGDDTYEIHNSLDQIVEIGSEGTDSVWTDVSYALGANVENMYLVGSVNGTGNGSDNTIVGYGVGNNTINGGAGNDLLYGGAGNDTFVFDSASFLAQVISGVDTLGDFTVNQDKIQLSKAAFSALTTVAGNPLTAADFGTVTTTDLDAGTLGRAIVYNSANGKLFYDTNGAAAGFGTNGGQFAQLSSGLGLTGNDLNAIG
jgi:Ca2+-binding RTX toxin-like protein